MWQATLTKLEEDAPHVSDSNYLNLGLATQIGLFPFEAEPHHCISRAASLCKPSRIIVCSIHCCKRVELHFK